MRKKTSENAAPSSPDPYLGLTPNQVVAFNLAQARQWRGWTQDQAAEALEPYLGKRWSKASVSQAERSIAGKFVRNFDADEIVAFARTFELPVTWFFMPPPPWASPGVPVKLRTPDAGRFGTQLALLADLVFGTDLDAAHLGMRLDAFFQQLGTNPLSDAQQRVVDAVNTRKAALVEHAVGDLQTWQTQLRALANHLEDLEARSRRLQ